MIMEDNNIKIKDSKIRIFITFLVFFLVLLIFNVFLYMFFSSDIPPPAWLTFLPFYMIFVLAIVLLPKNKFGLVIFSFSQNKISLIFYKKTYFETELDLINEIHIIKNTIEKAFTRYSITNTYEGYSIQFIGKDSSKEIRLWCCGFRKCKQDLIVESIIKLSNNLNKKVKILDATSLVLKRVDQPCWEIENFLKENQKFE